MNSNINYPLRFVPIFMERLWGGRRLASELGKPLPDGKAIGESWEICDHGLHSSVIANGPLKGSTLTQLFRDSPNSLVGQSIAAIHSTPSKPDRFPLLIKWIDAREKLSIQVHPPDGHPRLPAGELGKTECWFVVASDPGAEIYVGLRRGIDRQALIHELTRGTIDRCLQSFSAQPGDFYFVPAGTPHAIGAGVLLAEIQQTSDTTFRLSDWNRVDPATGRPRALHVEESLESIDFDRSSNLIRSNSAGTERPAVEMLLGPNQCRYFSVARRSLRSTGSLGEPTRFHILICLGGAARLHGGDDSPLIRTGDTVLLPAGRTFDCEPLPEVELIDTWVPTA